MGMRSQQTALPNFFAMQAYDTMWALAIAAENVNQPTIPGGMTIKLWDAIGNTKFEGISGYFDLVDGELKRPSFEVFNVFAEKENVIGNWTEGISFSINQLKQQPIWPGETTNQPPMNLRVGIPIQQGFQEFVAANIDDPQNSSGYCIEVFHNAIQVLPFAINFTFVPFANKSGKSNGSYDELLQQIVDQKVDAVVVDITIVANWSHWADFTLPYSQSGMTLLVCMRNYDQDDIWGYSVGFLNGSFVEDYLINQFGFSESQLKSCGSPVEYKEALDKGTSSGGVAAIFDEIPYIKVFLQKYPSGFRMVGTIYKTDGFGFAFPKGSPLVPYFPRAILNVTEYRDKMSKTEQKYFLNQDQDTIPIPDSSDSRLDVRRFGGLFIITAVTNLLALIIYLIQFFLTYWPDSPGYAKSSFTSKMVQMVELFYNMHFRSSSLQTANSKAHSAPGTPPLITHNHVNFTQVARNLGNAQSSSQQPTHRRVHSFSDMAEIIPPHVNLTQVPHNLGNAQSSSSQQATHSRVHSDSERAKTSPRQITVDHVNSIQVPTNLSEVNEDQMEHNAQSSSLRTTQSGVHSVFEIAEATTQNHDNSTEEPQNLGVKNED
ncbi:unnamed protein product [Citrullus colocynthis]|uniref:Ionotropic glutamate receptor C-terminal domain-containing protein n=1 Tax=Citrullus colocynthis TaxID=252529 RepID=A0ABP0ZCJ3_9ROSI